jgi:hypothetical protein
MERRRRKKLAKYAIGPETTNAKALSILGADGTAVGGNKTCVEVASGIETTDSAREEFAPICRGFLAIQAV